MDQIVGIVILLIILSLLDKVLRGQKGKTQRPPSPEDGWEAAEEERDAVERGAVSLRELLAEELGLNLERRPTVKELPEAASAQARPDHSEPVAAVDRVTGAAPTSRQESAAPPEIERRIHYPTPRRSERAVEPEGTPEWGHRIADERKRAASMRRRRSPIRKPASEEERFAIERGERGSLERPRRPEDHRRFHDRYGVPEPVSSHDEFHARYVQPATRAEPRRAGVILPDSPEWSAVQRAIIWSEILGPPRGLE
jgi:hypothetical protein